MDGYKFQQLCPAFMFVFRDPARSLPCSPSHIKGPELEILGLRKFHQSLICDNRKLTQDLSFFVDRDRRPQREIGASSASSPMLAETAKNLGFYLDLIWGSEG
jgi:hypothetical protein